MENNNNSKNILIGVLVILVIALGGYLGYDKFLRKDKEDVTNNSNNSINENQTMEEKLSEIIGQGKEYSYSELEDYFEDYLKNIPTRYSDSKLTSYNVDDLTDDEISMFVWRNIWNTTTGDENGNNRTWSVDQVNDLLEGKLNLSNYTLKEMEESLDKEPFNICGLKKVNNNYVATMASTEGIDVIDYEVNKIEYDVSLKEVKVAFDLYVTSLEKNKIGEGTVILKPQTTSNLSEYPFYLEKIDLK